MRTLITTLIQSEQIVVGYDYPMAEALTKHNELMGTVIIAATETKIREED